MRVSIVLPTFRERDNIVDLIDAIEASLQGLEVEVIVVDDNSPDGTADVVRARMQQRVTPPVRLFVRTQERGLATAIKFGLRQATGDVVVVMDTDFNHDPKMIPQMVKFLEYYDLIIGSRFVMGGGMEDRFRYFYSFLYNFFVRLVLGTQVQDNLSGFFAMSRGKLMSLDLDRIFRGYGEYFIRLLFVAWRKGYRLLEVPVFYVLRRHGTSKSQFFKMLRDYTRCVLSLRLRKWA
jgi:dolichol-phosphate mannosyltransferase